MKCPFCNGGLVGTIGHPICRNQNCVMCDDPMPQDLLEELIRTRKALDCAINTLDTVYGMSEDDGNIETYIKCKRIEINSIIKGSDNE